MNNLALSQTALIDEELDFIVWSHALSSLDEITFGRSPAQFTPDVIARIVENEFYLPLRELYSPRMDLESSSFSTMLGIERRMHAFFVYSRYFSESALEYVGNLRFRPLHAELHRIVSGITELIEINSSRVFSQFVNDVPAGASRKRLIQDMCRPGTNFESLVLNLERIPQIEDEIRQSGMTSDSRVLVLGCGAFPLSGFGYALTGAQVILADRDPRAFKAAEPLLANMPSEISSRISFRVVEGRDLEYNTLQATHLLVSGLVDSKAAVLARIAASCHKQAMKPLVLVRTPQPNLLELYYYKVPDASFDDFRIRGIVDIGVEGFNRTYVLEQLNG